MTDLSSKPCAKCGETKSLDLYHRDRTKPDGRHSSCKECRKAREVARYHAAPQKHRQARRQRYYRNPGAAREANRRYQARNAQRNALTPPTGQKRCSLCGLTKDIATGFQRDRTTASNCRSYCRECAIRKSRERYYADVQATRAKRLKYARSHREKLATIQRRYVSHNRDWVRQQGRAWRLRNKPAVNWRQRRRYYANRERILSRQRVLRPFWNSRQSRDPLRDRFDHPAPLDERRAGPSGRPMPSLHERVADGSAVDPAQHVLSAAGWSSARSWVEALPDAEHELLTVYVNHALNVNETAHAMDRPVAEVEAVLRSIVRRARTELQEVV